MNLKFKRTDNCIIAECFPVEYLKKKKEKVFFMKYVIYYSGANSSVANSSVAWNKFYELSTVYF